MRVAASMNYGNDDDLGLLRSEVDGEGKARHQCTACIAMNNRVSEWLFGNKLESSKCFVQEFVP
jgi:hypothetical protein